MSEVKTVTLELLRHGPPENQLLSPLTPYMGLSDGHEAATINLPYDHAKFLVVLNHLRYSAEAGGAPNGDRDFEMRQLVLRDAANQMGEIFGAVPGLISGLRCETTGEGLTHLRLVFSAAELAMLPFELAHAPAGFPGEGRPLSLQQVAPVMMTREIRGATGHLVPWPRRPKVLFVSASPAPFAPVPHRAHLLALTQALSMWMNPRDPEAPPASHERYPLSDFLTFLPNATLRDIDRACSEAHYTHVHILAHGAEAENRHHSFRQFAVALASGFGDGRADLVTAERLVEALRGRQLEGGQARPAPAVVSLATCDSANVGNVLTPASSLAHQLHASGVPLVVASQYPLTMRGSVTLASKLYGGLLQGDDPRQVVHEVRRALRVEAGTSHDWASLVAYTSLPADLQDQLRDVRYEAMKHAFEAVSYVVDRRTRLDIGGDPGSDQKGAAPSEVERYIALLDRFDTRMPKEKAYALEGRGILASKEKRKAQALFVLGTQSESAEDRREYLRRSLEALQTASRHYQEAAKATLGDTDIGSGGVLVHWVLVQWLCIDFLLRGELDLRRWYAAKLSADIAIEEGQRMDRAWAHASLMELELLRLGDGNTPAHGDPAAAVVEHAVRLRELTPPDDFARYSTRRQLERYTQWWGTGAFSEAAKSGGSKASPTHRTRMVEVARAAAEELPWSRKWHDG